MIELILLFALWPFHHKAKSEPPQCGGCEAIWYTSDGGFSPEPVRDGKACDKSGNLYFYTGDDKMTGISGASCEGAKDDWRKLHIEPVRMSRS